MRHVTAIRLVAKTTILLENSYKLDLAWGDTLIDHTMQHRKSTVPSVLLVVPLLVPLLHLELTGDHPAAPRQHQHITHVLC